MRSTPYCLKLFVIGILIISGYEPLSGQQQQDVRMQLIGESPTGLFEPVYATFTVENHRNTPIQFDLGLNRKDVFTLSITLPDGSVHQTDKIPYEPELGANGRISVAPGQVYSQRLLLNEWYDFPAPRTYTVRLMTNLEFQPADPITVTIGARDDQHLRDLCAVLATKALSYIPPQEEQSEAALALSHIRDPMVVPFLQQVLESGSSAAADAAEGLGRIASSGHGPAIDVLNASLGRADEERRSYVMRALFHAHDRTNNEEIKSRIEDVLPELKKN